MRNGPESVKRRPSGKQNLKKNPLFQLTLSQIKDSFSSFYVRMHVVLNKICYSLLYKSLHSRKNLKSLHSDVRMTITCNTCIEISTKFNARTYAGVTSFKKYLTYLLSDSVQLRKIPIPMQILVFSGTEPFKISLNMKNIISTTTFIQFIKNIFQCNNLLISLSSQQTTM